MNVVLVEPEIPQNTGNIGRLCMATNSTLHLVEPLGFSIDDNKLKRAGLDYWEHLKVRTWTTFSDLQAAASAPASFYYVTTKSKRPYTEPSYDESDYLVFGRETAGLPVALLEANREQCITIPMWNQQVRSLN